MGTTEREPRVTDLPSCLRIHRELFDALAPARERWLRRNRGYHRQLEREYRFFIPAGLRVLEVGCGLGNLLAAVEPSEGVGVDLSAEMVRRARRLHPGPRFRFDVVAAEEMKPDGEPFDAVILSDLLPYVYDIRNLFEILAPFCHPRTRLVMNFHSRLWEPVFALAATLRMKATAQALNWVTREDVDSLLHLAGFETVWSARRILLPARTPILAPLCNRVLAQLWPVSHLCVTNVLVARPVVPPLPAGSPPRVSVVVPCRNEAGNIAEIVRRTPDMGAGTEILLVEGGSTDDTLPRCHEVREANPQRDIRVMQQRGRGKGDAVRHGFAEAKGDLLMILDADMTVPPEDLAQFYDAIATGRLELANGSRLVYSMEAQAMRWLNLVGNKFFSHVFSVLLGQPVKDTLCGTKVLLRRDYERIAAGRDYFGELDPFGDFDLLFGAAKLGLRIRDVPIRYRERSYGTTNIRRFSHGLLLLRMSWLGLWRLRLR